MKSQSNELPTQVVQDSIISDKPTGFSLIIPCFVNYETPKHLSLRDSNLEIGAKWKQRGLSFEFGFDPSKVNILKHFKYKEAGFCISHERAVTFNQENSRIFFPIEYMECYSKQQFDNQKLKSSEKSKLKITRFSTLFGNNNPNSNTSVPLSRGGKLFTEAKLLSGEIIIAAGLNSPHYSDKSDVGPMSSPAVLVLNLSNPECREKYQEFLSETLLPSRNREEFLRVISGYVGQSIEFRANANDAESTPIVYPISTFMEIHADKDYSQNYQLDDESDFTRTRISHPILSIRELATLTKTRDHGSDDSINSRVERAKEDILKLSDNFCTMITKRGAVFFTGEKIEPNNRFPAAKHYVTTLYSGVISLVLLAQSCNAVIQTNLTSLANEIASLDLEENCKVSESQAYEELQNNLLRIQKQLFSIRMKTMWLDMNLNYFYLNEKRNIKSIAQIAAKQFSLDWNSKRLEETAESVLSVIDIQRRVASTELESIQIYEREASQESRDQTNFIIAIFTFITLPLAISYPLFEFGWIADDRRDIHIFWIITIISILFGFSLVYTTPKIFKYFNRQKQK